MVIKYERLSFILFVLLLSLLHPSTGTWTRVPCMVDPWSSTELAFPASIFLLICMLKIRISPPRKNSKINSLDKKKLQKWTFRNQVANRILKWSTVGLEDDYTVEGTFCSHKRASTLGGSNHNSLSRGSTALFWLLRAPTHTWCTYRWTDTCTYINKNEYN